MMAARTPVDVAVGILVQRDGRLLLASRPQGKPYADYWEFPGGKVETGESIAHALRRELHEELGVDIGPVYPWIVRVFEYPHALVRLHFCRVFQWSGVVHAREGQQFGFFPLEAMPQPLLPATVPVLRGLGLPTTYALSAAGRLGRSEFLQRFAGALDRGVRLVQLREPDMPTDALFELFEQMRALVRPTGTRLLVNSRHPTALWDRADGVHLTSAELRRLRVRPALPLVAASVHDSSELAMASDLGVDFAVLGPVERTPSHPDRTPLGWPAFKVITAATAIPVYALGGLQPADLQRALTHGAHGVALLTAAWDPAQWRSCEASPGGVSSASAAGAPGTT